MATQCYRCGKIEYCKGEVPDEPVAIMDILTLCSECRTSQRKINVAEWICSWLRSNGLADYFPDFDAVNILAMLSDDEVAALQLAMKVSP
jgi:hypothetical protein